MTLILEAGARRGGNGAFLRELILNKLHKNKESNIVHVRLWDLHFKGCDGCKRCRKNNTTCVIEDDLLFLWDKIKDARTIICISPNYYGAVSGVMKKVIDRLYCMVDENNVSRFNKDTKAMLILTQGGPNTDTGQPVVQWFKNVMSIYGVAPMGFIVPGCSDEHIDNAKLKGEDLLASLAFFA